MKVSVILTSYNRPHQIQEAIGSVQAQTYTNWELIVVDDNSNQETKETLAKIMAHEPRCTIIQTGVLEEDRPKTVRYATCINLALKKISGELVTYLTDDDIFYPERFQKMIDVFEKNQNICVIYGQQRIVEIRDGQIVEVGLRPLVGVTRDPAYHLDHNSVMHRRTCFDLGIRWNDDPLYWTEADAQFFIQLARHWDFHPVNYITDEHRLHHGGIQFKRLHGMQPWDNVVSYP